MMATLNGMSLNYKSTQENDGQITDLLINGKIVIKIRNKEGENQIKYYFICLKQYSSNYHEI